MKDTGGLAFPFIRQNRHNPDRPIYEEGMTLRDYFAGQAIIGPLTHKEFPNVRGQQTSFQESAYLIADAMIEERKK